MLTQTMGSAGLGQHGSSGNGAGAGTVLGAAVFNCSWVRGGDVAVIWSGSMDAVSCNNSTHLNKRHEGT